MPAETSRAPIGALRAACALGFLALFCGHSAWGAATDLPPEHLEFFESKVRPILVEHCYKCHSEESGKSKGGLLLDSRAALRKGGGGGPAIIAGDPEKSLLIEAVRYKNEDLQMPPAEEGGKLSPEKIAALEHWVKLGAPDPRDGGKPDPLDMAKARQHWAFQPVVKPAIPGRDVRPARPRPGEPPGPPHENAVDAFVRAKLAEKNLSPAAPADPRTLLRRITYDLTGLPPTAAEMDAFLADSSPEAYARVVDRLLASPRYGERWGRFWLDVARYADTKGYLAGNAERRYPFSHTYRDYVIRAFNEDKPYDRFIVEQLAADRLPLGEDKSALAGLGFLTLGRRFLNNQNDIIDDRIDVVTRGFLGLTVSCARCHDHKFDPIPITDYYSLHGVFASSEEPEEKPLLGPLAESPAYEQFVKKKADLEAKIKARSAEEVKKFLATTRDKSGDYLLAAHDAARLSADEKLDSFAGVRKLNLEVLKRWQTFLAKEDARRNPVLAAWFALAELPEEGFAAQVPNVISDLGARAAGPQADASERAARAPNAIVLEAFAKTEQPITSLKDAAVVYNRICSEAAKAESTEPDRAAIRELLFADHAPPNLPSDEVATMLRREINNRTAGFKREIEALNWTEPGAPLRAMAMVDKSRPANSRVMLRGNPANRGPEAPRQFLTVLSGDAPIPLNNGSGRLELAEQIASASNPLTARVLVNRVWGWHFGRPLVPTTSDFGIRTEAPVHRELLDWLAATFVEGGWSIKNLHRVIVLSSTYRQSSDGSNPSSVNSNQSALMTENRLLTTDPTADPDNQLLHRFNRRRLEFEALRDTMLAVAGTLDPTAGGLPDDLTKEPFVTRRTVYGFIDRQNLPGMFRTFDYPNPDVSSAGRFATTVPQQALFMMNSPFVQEQARALARRAEGENAVKPTSPEKGAVDLTAKIQALYRLVHQRAADVEELSLAREFLERPLGERTISGAAAVSVGWQYGRGRFDADSNRVQDFEAFTVRQAGRLQPTERYPDPVFGPLSLSAVGGHASRAPEWVSVLRWTAPGKGTVRIEAALGHAQPAGDGVRGRVVSSRAGKLGEWAVHNDKAETKLDGVEVRKGETIDFIVDGRENRASDHFTWAPTVAFSPDEEASDQSARTWNARKDFDVALKVVEPLSRWEELAQVLLLSNELAFVD